VSRPRSKERCLPRKVEKRLACDGHGVLEYACDPVEDAQARVSASKTAAEIARASETLGALREPLGCHVGRFVDLCGHRVVTIRNCERTGKASPSKKLIMHQSISDGRGSRIRTCDLKYPKLPRYQAALYPECWLAAYASG
jgi:hypothetical protein